MDRRQFKIVQEGKLIRNKHAQNLSQPKADENQKDGGQQRLDVLQELGNQLQVKAEKMRLLAKAEEGLDCGDFNPYATVTMSPRNKSPKSSRVLAKKIPMEIKQDLPTRPVAIPPSAARKKRREKKSHGQPGLPSTIDIKQYRPGYTWNKGGRMKELRIRNLARKFLRLWKLRVFGRVTPSQASGHYEKRLLKKCYRVWHGVWWELRKEWRLIVRAECHHRFVLFTKTFRAWKIFVITQKVKNSKLVIAEKHASHKFQRKCFDAWLVYVDYRRTKTRRKQQAMALNNNTLLRKYWSHWLSQYELVLHRQHMEVVALQFWAYRLQAQHWLIWQHKINTKKRLVQVHFKAIRHHNTCIAKRCLQAWIKYRARRRQKKQEKAFGDKVHQRMVVNRCFQTWLGSFRFRQALLDRQERMEELAEMFQKRRMFLHWRHFIEQVHEERDLLEMAEKLYHRKLLLAGFSAFRLSVVQKKLKLMRQEMADQLRYKQLVAYGWNTWLLRCENKEELKIVVQSQKARKHYRLVILRKCLHQLYNYAVWRQNRQAQYARADAHFYMTEVPKFMFTWKIFVGLMKNKRENEEHCLEFRRENLQARFFYMWVSEFEISRENRMNERMAILHYDDHLARRFFSTWKQKTADRLLELEHEEEATIHYNEVLCRSHFRAWRLYIIHLKQSQQQDIEATTQYSRRLLKICYKAWILYTKSKLKKKQKYQSARQHYERVVCKKMLGMWLHFVDMQRCIYQRTEVLHQRQCQKSLRHAFLTWKENVAAQISERKAETLAKRHYEIVILSQIFKCWHRFAAIHAYKKSETRQWVTSAQDYLKNKLLKIYFDKWKKNYLTHAAMRLKYEKAIAYHSGRIKHKVVTQWKLFTQESIRNTLLKKQSDWFLSIRLKARYFIAWKHAMAEAEREKEKTSLALWHWCLSLHRKVLIAWFSYTQSRKHKKELVAAAMERRRKRLLKEGVKKWLCVADDLSAMRKNFAAQQQAQSAFNVSRRVLKIGLHWKHWAAKRAQSHLNDSKDTPRSQISMPILSNERGDELFTTTPRSVVSVIGIPDLDKQRELKIKSAPIPVPSQAISPGRPIEAVSRISSQMESERSKPQQRARPRRPDFLVESLKRAGLFSPYAAENHLDIPTQPQGGLHKIDNINQNSVQPVQSERQVEKLNLSNLVSNQSVTSTDRTDNPGIDTANNNLESAPFVFGQHVTVADSARSYYSESQVVLPQGWVFDKGKELTSLDKQNTDVTLKQESLVPKLISSIRLMTPADFLGKPADCKTQGYVGETALETVSVASQSVASTPRILCQMADHGHPLHETRSFQVTDFRSGEVTPRSTVSCTTPRDPFVSMGFEPIASTQNVKREIVIIRNRLKLFEQKKKKLRTMQKQLKQLSDWQREIECKGQSSEDDDVMKAKQEIEELTMDISILKRSIEEEKEECTGLVDKVKDLMAQLTTT